MIFLIIFTILIFLLIVSAIFSFIFFTFDIFFSNNYKPQEIFIFYSLFVLVIYALFKGLLVLDAYKYFLKKIKQKEVK